MRAVVLRSAAVVTFVSALVSSEVLGCASPSSAPAPEDRCAATTSAPLVTCPSGETLKGIDVSTYQGVVAWPEVRAAGNSFAFARVTNGLLRIDDRFAANWPAMKKAGLVRGAYQYFRPAQDPVAQAELMLAKIAEAGGLEVGDLPPVVDLETSDGEDILTVVARAEQWLAVVEPRIGTKAIVYTGSFFGSQLLGAFADRPLWVPGYKVECPKMPEGWTRWHFWQSAEDGKVAGITGAVDLDHFDGTSKDLLGLTLQCLPGIPGSECPRAAEPVPAPEPAPEPPARAAPAPDPDPCR